MQFEMTHRPASAALRVRFEPSETLLAEGGSMISMSAGLQMSTSTMRKERGGMMGAVKRMVAGEDLFINRYLAPRGGELWLAPTLAGDMTIIDIKPGQTLIAESGSWLAGEDEVDMSVSWQGFGNALLGGEGLFWLRLSGQGKVVLSSYGAISSLEVDGEYIVDTGHIVAYTSGLSFATERAGGNWMSTLMGGEGLVARFRGRGTLWVQSHNAQSFGQTLGAMLKPT